MQTPAAQKSIQLTAGSLVMDFEPATGSLRSIRCGSSEVLRGVFAAVRDQDWNTLPTTVRDLHCDQRADEFSVDFVVDCLTDKPVFEWHGRITGTAAGKVTFDFQGRAIADFRKNRIGLCVLHPLEECVGQPCEIEHCDGTRSHGSFPLWISPHQPFKNMRAITHALSDKFQARVTFSGEPFEMEDQRNWSDASFKTYSTPLELPFPVELKTGHPIRQQVTLELLSATAAEPQDSETSGQSTPSQSTPAKATPAKVEITQRTPVREEHQIDIDWNQSRRLAPVGFVLTGKETADVLEKLAGMRPAHLRVDLDLAQSECSSKLTNAITLAQQLPCQLEVAIMTESFSDPQWAACCQLLSHHPECVARWLLFHPVAKATPPALSQSADVLRELVPSAPVVVGTNNYFAELNRNRPTRGRDALVCYSVNPQVHAFDNRSLCETLAAHSWMVDTAHHIFDSAVLVSPITLLPRFNPNATSAQESSTHLQYDARQYDGFGAAWTVALLARLAVHPQVAGLTFYETCGPRGIMDASGQPYPMFECFQRYCAAEASCSVSSSHPDDVSALALIDDRGLQQLLVANLKPQSVVVHVHDQANDCHQHWNVQPESVLPLQMPQESRE